MSYHEKIKELNSKRSNPLSSEFVLNWLKVNWQLFINTVDDNSCTFRSSPFPCFCCSRKDDCLFCDIYTKLSVIENFDSLNKLCLIQLENYKSIENNFSEVQFWLKQNLDLGLNKLNEFPQTNLIRRSFINGKNNVRNEFDYKIIYISLNEFSHNLDFKTLFNDLFFEQKLLENEYANYLKELEQLETI